eukprot:4864374-Amphidinium_carterae.1
MDDYENHSARSVRFVHDMEPTVGSSGFGGEGLPTSGTYSNRESTTITGFNSCAAAFGTIVLNEPVSTVTGAPCDTGFLILPSESGSRTEVW